MRPRFFIILFCLTLLQFVGTLGCQRCTDQKYFSVIDLFLENGRILDEATKDIERIEVNEHIEVSKFCITLTTGLEYASTESDQLFFHTPLFSFNTLNASCESLSPLPAHYISQFSITSNADFIFEDEVFIAAGQKLNDFFVISYGTQNRISLSAFLNSPDNHPMEIPFYLFLNTNAAYNQIHRFSVEYTLDDDQAFDATTEKVIIVPN